jgi:hypothetical protein
MDYLSGDDTVGGVYCSIPVTNVGAGSQATIKVEVSENFQVRKFVIGANRSSFTIDSMTVGITSQDVGQSGSAPGAIFTPENTVGLKGTIAKPGSGIVLKVTNTSGGALDFDGAFFGPAEM